MFLVPILALMMIREFLTCDLRMLINVFTSINLHLVSINLRMNGNQVLDEGAKDQLSQMTLARPWLKSCK